jgi:hypothetical protein
MIARRCLSVLLAAQIWSAWPTFAYPQQAQRPGRTPEVTREKQIDVKAGRVTRVDLLNGSGAESGTQKSGDNKPIDRNVFMQLKLQNAQAVLEGLALNDFKRIETSAEYLWMLSKKTEFQHRKTPEYKHYSDAFGRDAETLMKMASEKNLDGAARAYVQLTLNCVDCHKHLREVK